MTTAVAPDAALVRAAIDLVWGSMLFASVEPWPTGLDAVVQDGVRASIELRGDWNGRIALTCDTDVAAAIAGAMIGTAATELSLADVHDALGEVVNVVGGSVKGALGGVLSLSLPDVHPHTGEPNAAEAFVLEWDGAPLHVQIVAASA